MKMLETIKQKSLEKILTRGAMLGLASYFSISLALVVMYHTLPDISSFQKNMSTHSGELEYRQLALDELGCRNFKAYELDQLRMFQAVFFGSGSTGCTAVSRQLARRLFYASRKTEPTKLEEALMAIRLENELSKDTLLAMYIHQVFLAGHHPDGGVTDPGSSSLSGVSEGTLSTTEVSQLVKEMRQLINKSPASNNAALAFNESELKQPEPATPKKVSNHRVSAKRSATKNPKKSVAVSAYSAPTEPMGYTSSSSVKEEGTVTYRQIYQTETSQEERPAKKRWRKVKAWVKKSWKKVKTTAADFDL